MRPGIEEILRTVRIRDLELQQDHRVSPQTPLAQVQSLMDERRFGAVLVCNGMKVRGIFTQRDILYRTALERVDPETPIGELMSEHPVSLGADQRLAEAIAAMVEGGYRHIPVVNEEGDHLGLLSTRVILSFIADHFPETVLNLPPRLGQVPRRPEGG